MIYNIHQRTKGLLNSTHMPLTILLAFGERYNSFLLVYLPEGIVVFFEG